MANNDNSNQMVHHLSTPDGVEIILVGTAHVSRESVDQVAQIISDVQPDTVCVELCQSRFQALRQEDRWRDMDIIKVIKEKKAFLLLSNLILAAFQKRIAAKMDIRPGQEMIQAVESAEAIGAHVHLADRDIRVTLSRTWRLMGMWDKIKLMAEIILSFGDIDDISSEDIEKLKQADVLETVLSEVAQAAPALREVLIDERDRYLAQKIRTAPGQKIVAVVGAGHVPGIKRYFGDDIDLKKLEHIPPPGKLLKGLKWFLPLLIVGLFGAGFFYGGQDAGTDMLKIWILANGVLAGLGAALALPHPLTIVASVLAAPLTSLNPMMAAGWVSGLVEAMARKPKVRDFENLADDIGSIKGFWRNKITKILLVVVFTNLGSTLGTFLALPYLTRLMSGVV